MENDLRSELENVLNRLVSDFYNSVSKDFADRCIEAFPGEDISKRDDKELYQILKKSVIKKRDEFLKKLPYDDKTIKVIIDTISYDCLMDLNETITKNKNEIFGYKNHYEEWKKKDDEKQEVTETQKKKTGGRRM